MYGRPHIWTTVYAYVRRLTSTNICPLQTNVVGFLSADVSSTHPPTIPSLPSFAPPSRRSGSCSAWSAPLTRQSSPVSPTPASCLRSDACTPACLSSPTSGAVPGTCRRPTSTVSATSRASTDTLATGVAPSPVSTSPWRDSRRSGGELSLSTLPPGGNPPQTLCKRPFRCGAPCSTSPSDLDSDVKVEVQYINLGGEPRIIPHLLVLRTWLPPHHSS